LKGSNPNANLPPGKLILAKMACPGREKGMGQTSWMTPTHGNRAKMACAVHGPTSGGGQGCVHLPGNGVREQTSPGGMQEKIRNASSSTPPCFPVPPFTSFV